MSYIQIDIRHFAPIRKLTESSSHVEFPNATTIIYNFKDHQGHIYALLRKNWNMKCFQTSIEKWWEYFTWTFGLDVLKMASSVCWWSWCSFRAISFLSNWLSELGLGWLTQLSTIISAVSKRLVLLVEETRVPWENHRPVTSNWQTLSHNVVWSTPHMSGIRTHVSGDRHWLHR